MHSDWYHLFSRFWWLMFPLLGMGFGLVRTILAHLRANRGLDILKAYVDQGKEPPAELMQYLRAPQETRRDRGPVNSFFLAILFAGMAVAFSYIGLQEHDGGVFFVVIIMAALALGFTFTGLMKRSQEKPRELP